LFTVKGTELDALADNGLNTVIEAVPGMSKLANGT
jgi:hypothetical protein